MSNKCLTKSMTQWTFPCPHLLCLGVLETKHPWRWLRNQGKWIETVCNFFHSFSLPILFFNFFFLISPDRLYSFYEGPRFGNPTPGSQLDRDFATKIALDRQVWRLPNLPKLPGFGRELVV